MLLLFKIIFDTVYKYPETFENAEFWDNYAFKSYFLFDERHKT